MQFSVVAALSLAASASALPAKAFAGKTVKAINAAAVSNYTWTVSDWNASGSDHTYSEPAALSFSIKIATVRNSADKNLPGFVVSAPATTQGNTEIPALSVLPTAWTPTPGCAGPYVTAASLRSCLLRPVKFHPGTEADMQAKTAPLLAQALASAPVLRHARARATPIPVRRW